jgi:hypothetical protein
VTSSFARGLVTGLVVGLIAGGLTGDWWEFQRGAAEIAQLKVQQASRLGAIQVQIDRLTSELNAERRHREELERALADLRKGS